MASNPKMEYQVFLCIPQKNSAMATLCLKVIGKIPTTKVAIAKFIGKMQKNDWYYEKWVGLHASFPPR